jgi:uncharacterized membrane protein YphA (DoxX/SURF4 family)
LELYFLSGVTENLKTKHQQKILPLPSVIGIFFFIGFLTQLAALIAVALLGTKLISKIRAKAFLTDGVNYYLILFIISLCLLFSGAGFMAFDLPL